MLKIPYWKLRRLIIPSDFVVRSRRKYVPVTLSGKVLFTELASAPVLQACDAEKPTEEATISTPKEVPWVDLFDGETLSG